MTNPLGLKLRDAAPTNSRTDPVAVADDMLEETSDLLG